MMYTHDSMAVGIFFANNIAKELGAALCNRNDIPTTSVNHYLTWIRSTIHYTLGARSMRW